MEVVNALGNVKEEDGETNSNTIITNLSSPHIPTSDVVDKAAASASVDSQVIVGDVDKKGDNGAAMENAVKSTIDPQTCVEKEESDTEKQGEMETTENESKISESLKTNILIEGGKSPISGGSLTNGVEIFKTTENENKNCHMLDMVATVETRVSSTNGTTNKVENLESCETENKLSEISGVETLNTNGQNSIETTSTGHTSAELLKKGTEYREQESSDSDSDSSSSSSSSSSDEEEDGVIASHPERPSSATEKASNKFMFEDLKTEGEIGLDNLPPIEELSLDIEEGLEMVPVGTVSSVLGVLAIIQSAVGVPPLNDDTILFTEGPKVFGRIFEVFGPVSTPWYSVRFNSNEDIEAKGIKSGMKVFYAPTKDDYTKYVFVTYLKSLKGSDASWKDDNEPPEKYMEYSDDEEERASKSKSRAKERSKLKDEADGNEGDQLPGAKIRRASARGTGRPQKFWKDTEQHGQSDKTNNGWNNEGESYSSGGPQCSYGHQQRRGGGPRYAGQSYNRGGAAPPQHFRYPRPRTQGPFGRPTVFQSESPYNMNPGPGQFYQDNNRIISPGRFSSPGTQMGQNPHVGNTTFGSNFTNSASEWSNAEGYKPFPLPRQPVTDQRLVMNQDSQIQSFSTPPPTHQNSYNQNGGFDVNQTCFPPPPQSTQHITFQSPPPALNTSQFNIPPPFLPSSNTTKNNNSFIHNPAVPPPPLHPPPMANQQMTRPPYPQHPPVFGGQPHFTQGPSGRQ